MTAGDFPMRDLENLNPLGCQKYILDISSIKNLEENQLAKGFHPSIKEEVKG